MNSINQLVLFTLVLILTFSSYGLATPVSTYLRPTTADDYNNTPTDQEPIFTILPVDPIKPNYPNSYDNLIKKPNVKPFQPQDYSNYNNFYLKSSYVGKKLIQSDDLKILPIDCVLTKNLPKPYRILTPNSFSTMDYVDNRLNIVVDGKFKITDAYYG